MPYIFTEGKATDNLTWKKKIKAVIKDIRAWVTSIEQDLEHPSVHKNSAASAKLCLAHSIKNTRTFDKEFLLAESAGSCTSAYIDQE